MMSSVPPEGRVLRGVVRSTKEFGAFVHFEEYAQDGLVHISQLSDQKVDVVEDVVIPGDQVWVKVIAVERKEGKLRVSLSMKAVDQSTGQENARSVDTVGEPTGPAPKVYSIHRATIRSTKEFGAFAILDSGNWEGLVHISQLSNDHVDRAEDVVEPGDKVWVKVTEIVEDLSKRGGYRIGLTMKFVRQSDGGDLDPTNEDLKEDLSGHRPAGARRRVGVNIALKVSEHGGSTASQYGASENKYELIPEPPVQAEVSPQESRTIREGGRGVEGKRHRETHGAGRGIAATLPAWMTNGASESSIAQGTLQNDEVKKRKRGEDRDAEKRRKRRKKKEEEKKRKKKKKKKKKKRKKEKTKKKRRRKKVRQVNPDDDSDGSSQSSCSSSLSDSDSDSDTFGNFTSIEEAQKAIAALEKSLNKR